MLAGVWTVWERDGMKLMLVRRLMLVWAVKDEFRTEQASSWFCELAEVC